MLVGADSWVVPFVSHLGCIHLQDFVFDGSRSVSDSLYPKALRSGPMIYFCLTDIIDLRGDKYTLTLF